MIMEWSESAYRLHRGYEGGFQLWSYYGYCSLIVITLGSEDAVTMIETFCLYGDRWSLVCVGGWTGSVSSEVTHQEAPPPEEEGGSGEVVESSG